VPEIRELCRRLFRVQVVDDQVMERVVDRICVEDKLSPAAVKKMSTRQVLEKLRAQAR